MDAIGGQELYQLIYVMAPLLTDGVPKYCGGMPSRETI
jgi:hypothetical protein